MVIEEHKGVFEVSKALYETFKECVSKDETRYFMNGVYYDAETGHFVATDGRRLIYHSYESEGLESGYYDCAKIGKAFKLVPSKIDGQFPDWKRVAPEMKEGFNEYRSMDTPQTLTGKLDEDSQTLLSIAFAADRKFNLDYLLKVLKHADDFEVSYGTKEYDALHFSIDTKTKYVVMPFSKD